jgi:hypothetical protein
MIYYGLPSLILNTSYAIGPPPPSLPTLHFAKQAARLCHAWSWLRRLIIYQSLTTVAALLGALLWQTIVALTSLMRHPLGLWTIPLALRLLRVLQHLDTLPPRKVNCHSSGTCMKNWNTYSAKALTWKSSAQSNAYVLECFARTPTSMVSHGSLLQSL